MASFSEMSSHEITLWSLKNVLLKIHAFWRITSHIQASGITTIFSFRYQSLTWQRSSPFCQENLCSGCNGRINFVVILKSSFSNFVQTQNKYLRFRRFRRSYVHHLLFQPTTVKSALLFFFAWCVMFKIFTIHLFAAVCPWW